MPFVGFNRVPQRVGALTRARRQNRVFARRERFRRRQNAMFRRMPRTRIMLPVGGFPSKLMVKLRYCQTFTLNAGIGSYAVQEFRANSLYDPDFTGGGFMQRTI